MKEQIGYYDSGSHRFCYTDVKAEYPKQHSSYTIPVYADDDSKIVERRILLNQRAILAALKTLVDVSMSDALETVCIETDAILSELL